MADMDIAWKRNDEGTCWIHYCGSKPTHWLIAKSKHVPFAYAVCVTCAANYVTNNQQAYGARPFVFTPDPEGEAWD